MNPEETERGITWARETFASLTPHLARARYVNYLEDVARYPTRKKDNRPGDVSRPGLSW
jgi:hypothetical protein